MRKEQNKKICCLGLLLGCLLCLTACEQQTEETVYTQAKTVDFENETAEDEQLVLKEGEKIVYAKADASGKIKKVTIETLMKDEDGEEFRYKEETNDELPVSVKIHYYLDEEQMTPESLAGKSGKVKIRFDYENSTMKQEDAENAEPVPFTVITALVLPSDKFSNINVTNGKVISAEGQNMVIGYALPGIADYLQLENYEPAEELEIPEYVEITADVTEFELAFTATVITNGILEDLEGGDLDDMEEMSDSMDELKDAVNEMADGTNELYDGMIEFHDYLDEFSEGVESVYEGTDALNEGLEVLNDKKGDLKTGVETLNNGLKTLYASLTLPSPEDSESDSEGKATGTETDTGEDTSEQEQQKLNKIMQELGLITEEDQRQFLAFLESLNSQKQKQMMLALIEKIVTIKLSETLAEVQSGVGEIQAGSQLLLEGVDAFNEGVQELYKGSKELSEGAAELADAGSELSDGFLEVIDAVNEMKEGIDEFKEEGVQELEKFAGSELREIVSRLRTLKRADADWNASGKRIILETEEIK